MQAEEEESGDASDIYKEIIKKNIKKEWEKNI
jgi:hypothetical protein